LFAIDGEIIAMFLATIDILCLAVVLGRREFWPAFGLIPLVGLQVTKQHAE
jgi:hypothetical protein